MKCKICGSDKNKLIKKNEIIEVVRCDNCDFSFIINQPNHIVSDSTGDFSNTTTDSYCEHLLNTDDKKKAKYNLLAENKYRLYSDKLKKKNFSILEIGCGSAHQYDKFEALGANYLGIDINQAMVEDAQNNNFNVKCVDFFDFDVENKFDVILFSQVLEHITQPNLFIKKVFDSLNDNGILHVDVPNDNSLSGLMSLMRNNNKNRYKGIIYPEHCFSYNKQSLEYLLKIYFDDVNVFQSTSTSDLYGQTTDLTKSQEVFFQFSSLINKGNLLVGIAQK